jgi:hypothetical protein
LKGTRGEELITLSTIVIKNSCVLAWPLIACFSKWNIVGFKKVIWQLPASEGVLVRTNTFNTKTHKNLTLTFRLNVELLPLYKLWFRIISTFVHNSSKLVCASWFYLNSFDLIYYFAFELCIILSYVILNVSHIWCQVRRMIVPCERMEFDFFH